MSRKNNTKSQIFLMEFIVVVLFFSICVSICIGGFVKADGMSKDSKALNRGILLAQSAAECIKTTEEAEIDEQLNRLIYPIAEKDGCHLDVTRSIDKQMLTAVISVWNEKGAICEITVKKYLEKEGPAYEK